MTNEDMSWYSRAARRCLPDIAVTRPLIDGYELRVSIKKHLGLLRTRTRIREYSIALRIASLARPQGVIYDVGANIGLYSIAFASNRTRIVHSFEPSELALPYLRENVARNKLRNVHVQPVLLSDATGIRSFVLDRLTTAQSHVGDASEAGIAISCTDLDSYARKHALPAPDLVKVDVEGHDLFVLRGMKHILEGFPLVYLEGGTRDRDGRLDAALYLMKCGYNLWNLEKTVRLRPDTAEYAFLAIGMKADQR